MRFDEFMEKMLAAFPNAQVEEDNNGQLVIYTGLTETSPGVVERMPDDLGKMPDGL